MATGSPGRRFVCMCACARSVWGTLNALLVRRSTFACGLALVVSYRIGCGAPLLGYWILDLETGPNPTDYPRTSANVGA